MSFVLLLVSFGRLLASFVLLLVNFGCLLVSFDLPLKIELFFVISGHFLTREFCSFPGQ
ncbi:hypothetical protein [Peribacillus sp. Bi96]|uniref:hypothetical protein n=1 Tax=Peribacillus sp. Bi96 TaxID=2884273 RepID=UPI001E4747ED|nr:hypothetical protein [Peribacillus sp. Bi96]